MAPARGGPPAKTFTSLPPFWDVVVPWDIGGTDWGRSTCNVFATGPTSWVVSDYWDYDLVTDPPTQLLS